MRIALVVSSEWRSYYASSPYYHLLNINHNYIDVFSINPRDMESLNELRDKISSGGYIAAVFCESTIEFFPYLPIPRLAIIDDLHRFNRKYFNIYKKTLIADYFLSTYALTFAKEEFPLSVTTEERRRFIYFPHFSADNPCLVPHKKRAAVIIPGTVNPVSYPLRYIMKEKLADLDPVQKENVSRDDFVSFLGRYRVALTDDVRFGYAVAKYFEIPMAGTLLISPEPHTELERFLLGFNEENSSLIRRDKIYDLEYVNKLVRNAAENITETEVKAKAGQLLVRQRHTIEARARYLVALCSQIASNELSPLDQFDLFLASRCDLPEGKNQSACRVDYDTNNQLDHDIYIKKVLISVIGDFNIQEIFEKLPSNIDELYVIARTSTHARSIIGCISELVNVKKYSWDLIDRTNIEIKKIDYDLCLMYVYGSVHIINDEYVNPYYSFSNKLNIDRESLFLFIKKIVNRTKKIMNTDKIKFHVDENYDWEYGGINIWFWHNQEHSFYIRIEGVLTDMAYIGIVKPEVQAYKNDISSEILSIFKKNGWEFQQSDHWICYSYIPGYDKIVFGEENGEKLEEKISILISDIYNEYIRSLNFDINI